MHRPVICTAGVLQQVRSLQRALEVPQSRLKPHLRPLEALSGLDLTLLARTKVVLFTAVSCVQFSH